MKLDVRPMGDVTMYNLGQEYLYRFPSAMHEEEVTARDGSTNKSQPPNLHAAIASGDTAILHWDAGVDIINVKESLDQRLVTLTQIHDKPRRTTEKDASRDVPDWRMSAFSCRPCLPLLLV